MAGLPASHSAAAVSGQRRRRDGGQRDRAPARSCRPRRSSCTHDAAPDHGDVHFVARNEPQVGRAACFGRRRETRASPGSRRARARSCPARCRTRPTGTRAPALRAGDVAGHVVGDQRGNRVGRRRGVAQVAADAGPALDLPAADDPGRIGQRRIGGRDLRRRRRCGSRAPPPPAAGPALRLYVSSISSGIFLTSTTRSASRSPSRSCTIRSVPPVSTRARSPRAASRLTASSTRGGRMKLEILHETKPPRLCRRTVAKNCLASHAPI